MKKIKAIVVDDAAFMRHAITNILETDPLIQVIGTAENGIEGLEKIKQLHPDVITLDIDMPVMDGLTSIRHIMIESPVPVVVLSSLFSDGAITFEALRLGVVDFVPKPSGAISVNIDQAKHLIIDRTKMATSVNIGNIRRVRLPQWNVRDQLDDRYHFRELDYIITIGTNLSGPNTIIRFLTKLSPAIPAAIVVMKEISPKIIAAFVERFDEKVPWKIKMAEEGQVLEQGICYICSNEKTMELRRNLQGAICLKVVSPTADPLNVLFSSAAHIFQQNTIGLLLTGTGRDGADGFVNIKAESGVTVVQDAKCCVYPNLTENAVERGVVDMIVKENDLPSVIEKLMDS
ncbi:chemotaxis protein CheB [Desulfococcaceae bacterium HSG9]|nr:chemotaxis protein CheB [Desulfococcaceae bacterium HSG9]